MFKKLASFTLVMLCSTAALAQNCAWGNCTPQQVQQEYQQNQLRQLQGINNSLNQIQQQQQVAPAPGQWSNTPQRQQNCYRDTYGRVFCQ